MFIPLVAAVTAQEFVAYDTELQISMFESLCRVYGSKYLPDWLRAGYCYALNFPYAGEVLMQTYPMLIDFACTYCDYIEAGFADLELITESNRQAAEEWFANQEYEIAA